MNIKKIGSLVRVSLLTLALLAPMGLLRTTTASAAEPIKVGLITTLSGPNASFGDNMLKAAKLYVEQHAKDLGDAKVELVVRDDTGPNPDQARRLAQELIVRDRVKFLVGPVFTPNVAAIAPLVTQAKTPFVLAVSGTSSLTTESPYIVRTSFTVWQIGYTVGQWAAKNGIKTAYTAVPDYAGGYDFEAALSKGFTDAGGKIIGSVRMPVTNSDYTPFMQRIKDGKPQAVLAFVTGGKQSTGLIKAYSDLGMAKAGIKILGPGEVTVDSELQNMGDGAIGVVTASHYSAGADRPANKAFVGSWQKAYGKDSFPDFMAVGVWDAMDVIFHAIREQKGKVDADRSIEIMRHFKTANSPQGGFFIDPETRDIVQNVYIRRVERRGDLLVNAEFATVPDVKDPWKTFNNKK